MPPRRYRGRLIRPMTARIRPLDALMTGGGDPDTGAGDLQSGYDDDFRQVVRVPDGASQAGVSARVEADHVDLPAQVEDDVWERMSMERTGDDPATRVVLVMHMRDLEQRGLVDRETGTVMTPRVGDRLEAIVDPRSGQVTQVAADPGLYCTMAAPRSYGLSARTRNLLMVVFEERGQSRRSG